jgi:hypothetical protein
MAKMKGLNKLFHTLSNKVVNMQRPQCLGGQPALLPGAQDGKVRARAASVLYCV